MFVAIPTTGFSVISPCRWRPGIRDGIGESRRHCRCDRRGGGAGDRVRLWADGTVWKARKTGSNEGSAEGAAWPAAGQGAGGAGGPAIELTYRRSKAPCGACRSSLCWMERRRRCLIAPALGRPLNSSAAPDVRAPSVRGCWHFRACFGPFFNYPLPLAELRLGFPRSGGYTLAA